MTWRQAGQDFLQWRTTMDELAKATAIEMELRKLHALSACARCREAACLETAFT